MRMSMKAAVVTVATTALFAPAASALAASATIDDGKKDTWLVTYDNQGNTHAKQSDVTKNVDVKKTVIKFGKRIQVKQTFYKLSKAGVNFMPSALLETNKGDNIYMQGLVNHDSGSWTDGGYLMTGPQSGRHTSARLVDCNNLRTNVNWSTGVFTMSAPSSCLGKVRWIKVHASNYGQTYDAATDTYTNYLDNAHNAKANDKGWTGRIRKG